ncbi:Hypothetical predicted protein [Mytilus galloprovincialis]|uniref:Uncharacterized protein n=1 Tax=Mytilus galloprovincialis TaxID=29158 RepID=A0A8B6H3V6_MYTGA|nr:Hypothetical predicted protein [Mytilus galloprovincialis]
MEQDPKKKDRRRQKKMDSKPDSMKPSVSAEGRQQSAAVENETGKPVVAPPQEEEFPTEIRKEEPKTETKRTVEVEKREHQTTEFTMVDPKEYGIEIEEEEFKFEPPQRDDTLPDLRRLMDSLEDGQTDLEAKDDPPALFTGPTHIPSYTKISELKLQIEKSELDPYLDHFEEGVKDEVVMLGQISLEEVQEEEKRLRDEHIEYLDQEAKRKRDLQEEVLQREEEAKKRLALLTKQKRDDIARREEILRQKEKLLMDRLHRAYRRAESQLISTLESRKGEVKTFYGDLMLADGTYGGSKGRRWKVDWDKTPQPIQVKLKCLRGVREKLPGGRYVLMVSLYNRLGGHVLRWSKLKGQMWGAATLPIDHDGQFYNVEMKMDQSVFTVLPAKASLRPGMVLTFELFLLRGSVVAKDRVVAWGSFPICDGQFDVIEGKYRCPMLRGEMDPILDKHDKIEELMASDLDHWMSNLYFEIIKLPRYLAGQKEHEVELHFTSGLIGYPDRVRSAEEYRDGEKPLPGSISTMASDDGSSTSLSPTDSGTIEVRSEATTSKVKLADKNKSKEAQATTYGSRILHKDKKLNMAIGDSSDESDDELADLAIRKEEDFNPVKGMPGMYYKQYNSKPVDLYHKKLYSMLPKTPLLAPNMKKKKLTHVEELEEHSFAVQPAFAGKGRLARSSHEKLQYVGRQFLAELGLSQWRSREFWGMLLMFIIVFFLRMYMHYIGQWLFLNAISIPINKFNFLPYTVELNYQSNLMKTREEIAVVWLGPIMNIVIFILLVIFCWLSQKLFGLFPDIGCKFTVAYGLMTLLDPLFIMIVDCILKRYIDDAVNPEADFMKLYWHFERAEGSGLAGIFITSFLYLFIMFMTASIIYMYFLRLHNNGRMLDVYWRLHGAEDNFFNPYDLEVSNQELNYIVKKSEAWRGEEGERRKTAVYDYIWEEEDVEESIWDEQGVEHREVKHGRKEITTHVSIHTIHLDGLRELYRHFLRLPDGGVVEIFGDIAIPGMDKDIKFALEKGAKRIENLGSQTSLNRIRGRHTSMSKSGFAAPDSPTSSSSGSIRKKKMA